jgi:protein SMG6
MEYGKAGSVVRMCGTKDSAIVQAQAEITMMRVMAKKAAAGVPGAVMKPIASVEEEKMDVDGEGKDRDNKSPIVPPAEGASDVDLPPAFKYALQLTLMMLSFVLKKPVRKPFQYVGSTLNPYFTVIFTFLATVLKH